MAQVQTRPVEYPPTREFEEVRKPEFATTVVDSGPLENLRVLWSGRRFITKMALIGLIAGTLVAFLLPKRYTSVAELIRLVQKAEVPEAAAVGGTKV